VKQNKNEKASIIEQQRVREGGREQAMTRTVTRSVSPW